MGGGALGWRAVVVTQLRGHHGSNDHSDGEGGKQRDLWDINCGSNRNSCEEQGESTVTPGFLALEAVSTAGPFPAVGKAGPRSGA